MLATQQIFLIASLLCFLTFLTLLSVASDGVKGMRAILLASVLGMAGNGLYAFGRELPPWLAFEVANTVYAAASAALVAGYRLMAGLPARRRLLGGLVAGLCAAIALWHYWIDSFFARSAVVSLFQAAACADIARSVLAARRQSGRPWYAHAFVLSMCALVALGHGGRMAWLVLTPQAPTSLLQPSVWSISFLTAVTLAMPALAIGALLIAHRHIVKRAEFAANHDFLTGLASRKAFFDVAARELARAARHGRPPALLVVDLDKFKTINDGWGHEAGDGALRRVAAAARRTVRAVDCAARLGGDEFVLLLPETSLDAAGAVAARLRQAVRAPLEDDAADGLPPLTLSIGVTVMAPGEAIKEALARADAALYAAKRAGRDRVVAHGSESALETRSA